MTRNAALVALLVLATALFAVGVIAERSSGEESGGTAVETTATQQDAEGEGVDEKGHAQEGESAEGAGHSQEGEGEERLLGVDLESTSLVMVAVAFGLALAGGVALTTLPRRRELLMVVAAVTLVWAGLDVRELLHQVGESRTGIAVLAGGVAVLHLMSAALAVHLSRLHRAV